MERVISLFGLFVMIGLAWLMSSHKTRFPWRVVVGGVLLQFVFAIVVILFAPFTPELLVFMLFLPILK